MAENSFSSVEIDPATGLPKKPKQPTNQPYLNENGTGYLPVSPLPLQQPQTPQNPNVQQVQQGSLNTIATAQNAAQNAVQPTPIQQQANSMVQQQMTDPNFGYNPAAYNANALSNYDLQKSQAAKAFKQSNADIGGSGIVQENLLKTLLQNSADRSNLENQLDMQKYDTLKKNWADAISAGNTQTKSNADVYNAGINTLVNVAGAGEGTANRDASKDLSAQGFDQQMQLNAQGQGYDLAKMATSFGNDTAKMILGSKLDTDGKTALMDLQAKIDTGKQLTQNDFAATQAALDRKLEIAKQNNDIQGQKDLTTLKSTLDVQAASHLKGLDIQGQKELTTLQGQISKDLALNANSFKAAESALDRALEIAKQSKDIVAQKEIVDQKAKLDLLAQTKQNEFTSTITKATQSWQTGERLGEEQATKAMQAIDLAAKQAMQDNDINAQKAIATQKTNLELQLKTQDMQHDEAMAYLNEQIATAKANGDVGRQEQLIKFQTTQDINKMLEAGSIDEAKAYIKQQYDLALQNNDATNLQALEKTKQEFAAKEADENRALEQQRVDLEKAGVDMEKMNQTYTYLQSEVDAGRADPSVLTSFVRGVASKAGVTLTKPDPLATQKAAQQKYQDMLGQFALTHPGVTTFELGKNVRQYSDGKGGVQYTIDNTKWYSQPEALAAGLIAATGVSNEGCRAFNEFFNSTTYGDLTQAEKDAKASAGYLEAMDIPNAAAGDKFLVKESFQIPDNTGAMKTVPPGKYSSEQIDEDNGGSTFFGTKKTSHDIWLVDEKGKKLFIISTSKEASGNIVSNLWAGDV